MAKDRSLVRASDIGLWAFCQRAWWLAQVQHAPHQNPQVLARGTEVHARHGAQVRQAEGMQRIGAWLGIAALLALAAALVAYWIF